VHEYGFAISYPPDGEAVTGYIYEPWHIRYLGKSCAAEWRASGLVLVQFLERLSAAR
ncbi:MAG: D-alanyl-D-alanine carboxypeptidase family protein, partial [Chloroflexi bacterium]|nr:D-alanyl-D-alanine carboxypeptidase family protein [Chloroflexota bacterium]